VLAIETGGMFARLQSHGYWEKANCIIVSMSGVPTRATRRFIRRLSDEKRIPVYAFVDCDPYGISNIYRTLKVGSGNAAHISQFFCVPKCRFLGVTPQDIIDYKLPTHPLKDVDVKRAKDALGNDPFFKAHKEWSKALQMLVKMGVRAEQQAQMGVRAEQQALAKWGLNYVIEEYLPRKLKLKNSFLP
jgi:DNA topoisomerase-6 subunit A